MNFAKRYIRGKIVEELSARRLVELKRQYFLDKRGKKFFIACAPKSGSTFVSKVLAELTGSKYTHYFDEIGCVSEQNLSEIKMSDTLLENVVVHQHLLGSNENLQYLSRYRIKPIVLVRNIYDSILSLKDHMHLEGIEWPFMFHVNQEFLEWPEDHQNEFLISYAAPWYINFYASWVDAIQNRRVEALLLNYEELLGDKVNTFISILNFYHESTSPDSIRDVIHRQELEKTIRFNKGKVRNGASVFNESQHARLRSLIKFYPHINFSRIGIT